MIECPLCGRKYPVGALFCPECGVYLLTGGPLRTEPLPEGVAVPAEPPIEPVSGEGAGAQRLVLHVLSSGRRVVIRPDQEVLVGRLDVGRGIFPQVDLTPDGGLEGGVSRRHARIFFRNAINIGLPVLECPEAVEAIAPGDELEVRLDTGEIHNRRTGQTFRAKPYPPFMLELIRAGGLIPYTRARLQQSRAAG